MDQLQKANPSFNRDPEVSAPLSDPPDYTQSADTGGERVLCGCGRALRRSLPWME